MHFRNRLNCSPQKSTTALETATVILNYIGRFGAPQVIHTDQGPAFHNELVMECNRTIFCHCILEVGAWYR